LIVLVVQINELVISGIVIESILTICANSLSNIKTQV